MLLMPVSRSFSTRPGTWRALDRLLDDSFFSSPSEASRSPALDVSETEAAYVVTVDLPGVSKDQVKVSVEGRRVTLEAQAQVEAEKKDGDRVIYRERSATRFSRSFTLPAAVDQAASQAKLDNGVLTLTLAKKAPVGAAQIAVN